MERDAPYIEALVEILSAEISDDEDAELRDRVMNALVKSGGRAVPPLIKALFHRDGEVRRCAVEILYRVSETDKDAVHQAHPELTSLLNDADVITRSLAAFVLYRADPSQRDVVTPVLDKALNDGRNERDIVPFMIAAEALKEIGAP